MDQGNKREKSAWGLSQWGKERGAIGWMGEDEKVRWKQDDEAKKRDDESDEDVKSICCRTARPSNHSIIKSPRLENHL